MCPKDTALFWLSQGIASVPLCYRSKRPLVQWTPYKTQLPTEVQISLWYDDNRPKNIALVTGWCGICVLDFDSVENWAAWYILQLEYQPEILDTYRVSSNRGVHVYYYLSEPAKLNSIQGALYEIKCSGKLVTTPPSVHESGRVYTSLDDPTNIKVVSPEQILNYSPLYLAPVVYPLAKQSKYAPTIQHNNSESIIEQVKNGLSILEFVPTAKPLDGEGRYYRGDCPIHGRHNNFWIDKKSNVGGCYAGCGTFDVISLWAKLNNITNSESVQELRRLL
jgi:hypothetical protein